MWWVSSAVVVALLGAVPPSTGEGQGRDVVAEAVMIDAAVDVALGDADFVAIGAAASVAAGDIVRTDDAGFAEVGFHDGSTTRLDRNTEFSVLELVDDSGTSVVRTRMGIGRTWNVVQQLGADDQFIVETSAATATVTGTTFAVTCPDEETCYFTVLEGTVEVTLPDETTVTVEGPAEFAVGDEAAPPEPYFIDPLRVFVADPWLMRNDVLDRTGTDPGAPTTSGGASTTSAQAGSLATACIALDPLLFHTTGLPRTADLMGVPDPSELVPAVLGELDQLPADVAADVRAVASAYEVLAPALNAVQPDEGDASLAATTAALDAFFAAAEDSLQRVVSYFNQNCGPILGVEYNLSS